MVEFKESTLNLVTESEMEDIFHRIATPKKLGAIIKWEKDFTDSPSVFKKDGVFYMYFVAISKDTKISGYETHLAKSSDLVHWEYVGPILRRNDENHWDSKQCGGYAAFMDINIEGTNELQKVNGLYYMSYLAGNSDGYEPDPLFISVSR